MGARSLSSIVGLLLLFVGSSARADSIFAHDAATIGEHRLAVSADLSAGADRLLNDHNSLGMRARFDFGVTQKLQLGAWLAATYGTGLCIDRRSGPLPSGCIDTSTVAGGVRARLGLWRSSNDLLHVGIEAGLSTRPVPDTIFILGLFADANAQASLRVSSIGLAYARAGGAIFHKAKSPSPGPYPMGTLAVGFEFLPGTVHPFVEGNGTLLYYSQRAGTKMNGSAVVGVSIAWGQ